MSFGRYNPNYVLLSQTTRTMTGENNSIIMMMFILFEELLMLIYCHLSCVVDRETMSWGPLYPNHVLLSQTRTTGENNNNDDVHPIRVVINVDLLSFVLCVCRRDC